MQYSRASQVLNQYRLTGTTKSSLQKLVALLGWRKHLQTCGVIKAGEGVKFFDNKHKVYVNLVSNVIFGLPLSKQPWTISNTPWACLHFLLCIWICIGKKFCVYFSVPNVRGIFLPSAEGSWADNSEEYSVNVIGLKLYVERPPTILSSQCKIATVSQMLSLLYQY